MQARIVAHVDLDAFFASVEECDKPFLKGAPIIIGADPQGGAGRGVVSTASYAARAYGVHSAMPIRKAWQLCETARTRGLPACVFIVPLHGRYSEVSKQVFRSIRDAAPTIEQTSIDEGYIDLTFLRSYKRAKAHMQTLRRRIKKETGLTCSIGIGQNKTIAKLATEAGKPNGLTVVLPRNVRNFLRPQSVRALPGVGPRTEKTLHALGITTIAQLQDAAWEVLATRLGSYGFDLYERAHGIDVRRVGGMRERKSIGAEYTFAVDKTSERELLEVIRTIAAQVYAQVTAKKYAGCRTLAIKVRLSDFSTYARSVTPNRALTTKKQFETTATKLLLPFLTKKANPQKRAIRLVGVRAEQLCR